MCKTDDTRDSYIIAEYKALSDYFGKVITFRFTTAAFFIAAVALITRVEDPVSQHYLLLFAMSLGIWIVELRNRSLFDNLIRRARKIEDHWAKHSDGDLPFFTHMTPIDAAKEHPEIPKEAQRFDRARILWFPRFSTRYVSHTLGLDIVYLSVMGYSVWLLTSKLKLSFQGGTMDPILVLLAFAVLLIGVYLVRTAAADENVRWPKFLASIGVILILGAAILILHGILG